VERKGRKIKVNASSQQELDAAIKSAQDVIDEGAPQGGILFDTPAQMKVGIPEVVRFVLPRSYLMISLKT